MMHFADNLQLPSSLEAHAQPQVSVAPCQLPLIT